MITKEELVRIKQGDGLVVESNGIRHYNASEVLINGHSLTEVLEVAAAYKEEQPKVLDADGIEIKPGDELYYKDKKPFIDGKFAGIAKELHTDECPNPWEGNRPWVRYEEGGWDLAERLTHQKPENLQDVIDDLRKEMLSQEFGHIIRVPAEIINRLEAIAKRMGGDGERKADSPVEIPERKTCPHCGRSHVITTKVITIGEGRYSEAETDLCLTCGRDLVEGAPK